MKKNIFFVSAAMTAALFGTAFSVANAAEVAGWQRKGGEWQYEINGTAVKNNWVQSPDSGLWYYFDEDGNMVKDAFIDEDRREVADAPENYNHTYYYVNQDGAMCTGWVKLDGSSGSHYSPVSSSSDEGWYYLGENGKMQRDTWVQSDYSGLWYALDENGLMFTNSVVYNNIKNESGKLYYVNSNGAMMTGWYKTTSEDEIAESGSWIYCGTDGVLTENGWKKVDGKWYYFGEAESYRPVDSGMKVTEAVTNGGATYVLLTNALLDSDNNVFYLDDEGKPTPGLETFKNAAGELFMHYFDGNGALVKGDAILAEDEYSVIKAKEESGRYIAIDKDGFARSSGYAYTDTKNSKIFKVADKIADVPAGSYYYELNTSKGVKKN